VSDLREVGRDPEPRGVALPRSGPTRSGLAGKSLHLPRRASVRDGTMSGHVWTELAAPLPADVVQWRQQGRPTQRGGKWFAPFVAYIDAQFVRDRLDRVAPGEWNLSLKMLPMVHANGDGEALDEPFAFKARLQVLGAIREDVGSGRDYKTASTDAFKRAAVRYGIGHELYTDYEILYVQVDGDGKYAKALEDPAEVYARRQSRGAGVKSAVATETIARQQPAPAPAPLESDEPSCPKCGGRVWDNRLSKKNPRAPDFKCRNASCDGVIWPPKVPLKNTAAERRAAADRALGVPPAEDETGFPTALRDQPDSLPF
jgi:hypothetical protein